MTEFWQAGPDEPLEFLFSNSKTFKVRANPVNRKLSLEVAVTDQDISGTEYHGNRVQIL